MKLSLIIILSALSFSAYGQNNECKVVCAQKLNLDDPSSIIKNIKKLSPCGLDTFDVRFFSNGPILGTMMLELAKKNIKVSTWGDLLNAINHVKQTENYQAIRKSGFSFKSDNKPETQLIGKWQDQFEIVTDYEAGLSLSKKLHKPLLIYFNSRYSMNSRKLETDVFQDASVNKYLKNFIIVNLVVDDTTPLPKRYQTKKGKWINTVGEKNYDLQTSKFNANMQPFLSVISLNDNVRINSIGQVSPNDFLQFLIDAKAKWSKVN